MEPPIIADDIAARRSRGLLERMYGGLRAQFIEEVPAER